MIEFVGLPDKVLNKLLLNVGEDIDDILDTTRVMVQETVQQGIAQGVGAAELGDMLEQAAAFDEYRAETIARTETATLLNRASVESYREFGITHVTVIDGDDDDECAAANGQVWTLEQAEAEPIEHPNCVRDFAPFFGNVPETQETPEESNERYPVAGSLSEEERNQRLGYTVAPHQQELAADFNDPDYYEPRGGYGVPRGAEERLTFLESDAANVGPYATGQPYKGSYELAAKEGDMDEALRQADYAWLDASASPGSTLLQSSAAAEFDAQGMVWDRGQPMLEVSDYSRAVVRETFDRTQASLANGPDTFTVYRGVKSEPTVTRNVLESWTTDRDIAVQFDGGGIIEAEVPRSAVYNDLRIVDGETMREQELVLFGERVPTGSMRFTTMDASEAFGQEPG